MLDIEKLVSTLNQLYSDASAIVESSADLEEKLRELKSEVRAFHKVSAPAAVTIKALDAALIRSWLKVAQRVHNTVSSAPTPELDRLIDLLSEV